MVLCSMGYPSETHLSYDAKFHNDWTTETDVMDERYFVRFEFTVIFERISYIAQQPCFVFYEQVALSFTT